MKHYVAFAATPVCGIPADFAAWVLGRNLAAWVVFVLGQPRGTQVCSACCDVVHPLVEQETGRIIDYAENRT